MRISIQTLMLEPFPDIDASPVKSMQFNREQGKLVENDGSLMLT